MLAKPSAAALGITARPPFLDLLRQSGKTRGQQVTSSAQSDEILLDYMAPDAHFPELLTLAALANVDPDELITDIIIIATCIDEPFPASRLDPDG